MPQEAERGGAEQHEAEDGRSEIEVVSEAMRPSPAGTGEEAKRLANMGDGDDPETQRREDDETTRSRATPIVGPRRAYHHSDRKRERYERP